MLLIKGEGGRVDTMKDVSIREHAGLALICEGVEGGAIDGKNVINIPQDIQSSCSKSHCLWKYLKMHSLMNLYS